MSKQSNRPFFGNNLPAENDRVKALVKAAQKILDWFDSDRPDDIWVYTVYLRAALAAFPDEKDTV